MANIAILDADQDQQHLQALEQANRVRRARAAIKRQVAAGELSVTEVVVGCPEEVETMSISDLLMSQKRWGRTRCYRLLTAVGVPENKRIGTLTQRQRDALVAVLDGASARTRPAAARAGSGPQGAVVHRLAGARGLSPA